MNIGIVGSGNMGRTIGLNWSKKGHNVFFGHRRSEVLEQIKDLAGFTPIKTGSNQDAVTNSDVILYCLRHVMPSHVIEKSHWSNKIVIDLNNWANPMGSDYEPILKSIAESYQEDIPDAYVVKALNNHAQETFELTFDEVRQTNAGSFFCGNNEHANKIVAELINDTGLTPIESGKLIQARILENMAQLIRVLMKERGLFISYALTNLPQPNQIKFGGRAKSNFK